MKLQGAINRTSIRKHLKHIFCVGVFMWLAGPADAQSCIDNVEDAVDELHAGDSIHVCAWRDSPWEIKLYSNLDRDSGDFDGNSLSIFGFREDSWLNGYPNKLAIQLVQLTEHVWRVDFVLDGIVQKTDDRQQQFVWARDARRVPEDRGNLNETDVKYFYCIVLDEVMCRTTYNAFACPEYTSKGWSKAERGREQPGFVVMAKVKDSSPLEIFESFELVNSRMDKLLERVTIHSCRKGWIKL